MTVSVVVLVGEETMGFELPINVGMETFSFEGLDVYQRSIEFLALSAQVVAKLPRGHAMLADQLKRAALSIPLNIAEGSGRVGEDDARRQRAIARGSAMECAAILDACRVLGIIDQGTLIPARHLLLRIVAMLTRLSR